MRDPATQPNILEDDDEDERRRRGASSGRAGLRRAAGDRGPTVPNFAGKTMRAVLAEAGAEGHHGAARGSGIARVQNPPPPGPICTRENASASSSPDDLRRDTLGRPAATAAPAGARQRLTLRDWNTIRAALAPGYLFFAFPGSRADGRQFAATRWRAGRWRLPASSDAPAGVRRPWIQVEHGRQALALAARNFYGKPG